jgi:hypothetical protein
VLVGYRTAGLGTQGAGTRVASGPAPNFGTTVEILMEQAGHLELI